MSSDPIRTSIDQRLWDLVRHQRAELHDEDLITDEEYAALAFDHGAVGRLESYDELRADRDRLAADALSTRKAILFILEAVGLEPPNDPDASAETMDPHVCAQVARDSISLAWRTARERRAEIERIEKERDGLAATLKTSLLRVLPRKDPRRRGLIADPSLGFCLRPMTPDEVRDLIVEIEDHTAKHPIHPHDPQIK